MACDHRSSWHASCVLGLPLVLLAVSEARGQLIEAEPPAIPPRASSPASGDPLLWDNGDTDGVFAFRHWMPLYSTLDDFVVPPPGWIMTGFQTIGVHNTFPCGTSSEYRLVLWSDRSGEPHEPHRILETSGFVEEETGRRWFERPECRISVDVEPVLLAAGRYWLEMAVNIRFYQMGRLDYTGSPLWLNVEGFCFCPVSELFGSHADASFQVFGQVAFGACGELIQGEECVLFRSGDLGLYVLEEYGPFGVGDEVEVRGILDPDCNTLCQQGDGCIIQNTITACCPGDFDGDGEVAFDDLLLLLAGWGPCDGCPGDLDGDGLVDVSDLRTLIAGWGACV